MSRFYLKNALLSLLALAGMRTPVSAQPGNCPATVQQPASQTVCAGGPVQAITFNGQSATSFSWTNNQPSIGLAATGTGPIAGFTAVNNTNAPVTATVTVTPQGNSAGGGGGIAYVPVRGGNSVLVINTATNTQTGTINVGAEPVGVSVSPDGSRVYITNQVSNTVSVINTYTNTVVATIPVGTVPVGVAVSPDGSRVYVAVIGGVSVINAVTNTVIATVPVAGSPYGIIVSADGSKVFVSPDDQAHVVVINAATNTVSGTIPTGMVPLGMALSPNGTRLYVANAGSDNITVINPANNSVVATIPLAAGSLMPHGLAVTPDGSRVYVANFNSANVSVISTATNSVTATISLTGNCGPSGVSVTPDGSRVYVTRENDDKISVISTTTHTQTALLNAGMMPVSFGNFITPATGGSCTGTPATFTITVNPAQAPTIGYGGSAFCGNGNPVAVTRTGAAGGSYSAVPAGLAIDAVTGTISPAASQPGNYTVTYTVAASGGCPSAQAQAHVAIQALPTVSQVNDRTVCPGAHVNVGFIGTPVGVSFAWTNTQPAAGLPATGNGNLAFTAQNNTAAALTATIAVTPSFVSGSGLYAYVPDFNAGTLSVLNATNNTSVATIAVGSQPFGVALSALNSRVYVSNRGSNSVSVVNTATNQVVTTIPVGSNPRGVAVSPDGSRLYVANQNSGNVSVISTATNTVLATIPVGSNPVGLAVSPDGSRVYVANNVSATLSVINTATQAVTNLGVGMQPTAVAVSPDGSRVYVSNYGSNTVSVVQTANLTVGTVPVGRNPMGVAVAPNGSHVYVANYDENTMTVIQVANLATVSVPVGQAPYGVSVSPDGSRIFVAAFLSNQVSMLNAANLQVLAQLPAGDGPVAIGQFAGYPSATTCVGAPRTFTITVNPAPTATISYGTTPLCRNGGTVLPTRTGSTGGIFSIVPAAGLPVNATTGAIDLNGATPGTYTVTYALPASGSCPAFSTTATITVRAQPNATIAYPQNNYCPAGTATPVLTGDGGGTFTSPNGLVINPQTGVVNLATSPVGTHQVSYLLPAQNNTCVDVVATYPITIRPVPVVNQPADRTVCPGEQVNITFAGAPNGVTFSWTNSVPANGLAANGAGTISFAATNTAPNALLSMVTVTPAAHGCTGTPRTFALAVNPRPAQPLITQNGGSLHSSAPAGNQWYFQGNALPGATAATFTPTQSGAYTVIATVGGCSSNASAVHNFVITSVRQTLPQQAVLIGPNPVLSQLQVQAVGRNGAHTVQVFSMLDVQVRGSQRFNGTATVDMSLLPAGSYFIEVIHERSGDRLRRMVVKP